MTKFILLSTPAICHACGKMLRAGRGAFWSSSAIFCMKCMRKGKGEAEETEEEKVAVKDLVDGMDEL